MKFEEKHRPKTLDDIIFVDAYVERIVKETAANKTTSILFCTDHAALVRARPQT